MSEENTEIKGTHVIRFIPKIETSKTTFKIKEGKDLERFNYLLLYKSKSEIAELLLDAESKLDKINEILKYSKSMEFQKLKDIQKIIGEENEENSSV